MKEPSFDRAVRKVGHLLAAATVPLGLLLGYLMWKEGERGPMILVYAPLFVAGAAELMALLAVPISKILGTYDAYRAQYEASLALARQPPAARDEGWARKIAGLLLGGALFAGIGVPGIIGFLMVLEMFVELPRPARELVLAHFWPIAGVCGALGAAAFAVNLGKNRRRQ